MYSKRASEIKVLVEKKAIDSLVLKDEIIQRTDKNWENIKKEVKINKIRNIVLVSVSAVLSGAILHGWNVSRDLLLEAESIDKICKIALLIPITIMPLVLLTKSFVVMGNSIKDTLDYKDLEKKILKVDKILDGEVEDIGYEEPDKFLE